MLRPIAQGTYPVILSYGPYAKWLHFADGMRATLPWSRLGIDQVSVNRETVICFHSAGLTSRHPALMAATQSTYDVGPRKFRHPPKLQRFEPAQPSAVHVGPGQIE